MFLARLAGTCAGESLRGGTLNASKMTNLTLVSPFVAVMVILWLGAWLIARFIPSFRRELLQDTADPRFVPQLEGLRGPLAFGVFIHHASVIYTWKLTGVWREPSEVFYAQLGSLPVSFFFALTGYLFWSKLLRTPKLAVLPFLQARLRRLGPVYFAAVALVFLLVAWNSGFTRQDSARHLFTHGVSWLAFGTLGLPTLNGFADTSYIIANTPWTLALEWEFYILLPFLAWFARNSMRSLYLVGAALLARLLFSVGVPFLFHPQKPPSLIAAFASFFAIGILVATIRHRTPGLPFAQTRLASLITLSLMAFVAFALPPVRFSLLEALLLFTPFLLIVSGTDCFGLLTSAPALVLGKVSYSCYLLHGILLWFVATLLERSQPIQNLPFTRYWLLVLAEALVLLAVSALSYRWLEYPYLKKSPRIALQPSSPAARSSAVL